MAAAIKPEWSKPSAILFASEFPADEKVFACALAQAAEFESDLIIFHAYDAVAAVESGTSAIPSHDCAAGRAKKEQLEPLAERAMNIGIHCNIVVRPGLAADQILVFLREQKIDRVVLGAHSPGPVGKLLVGSVAEAVLRKANVPVCIVGPNVVESTFRNSVTHNILCDVSKQEASHVVANFGAALACRHKAGLILQQVIPPQERDEILVDRTIDQIEAELPSLVPAKLQHKVRIRTRVTFGDPTEELLYQGRAQQANLIILVANGASPFAAVTRSGIVYKVLAFAHCPVITLSPILLAECGARPNQPRPSDVNYLTGVF
jgi:nucleotide-binding universal stress UspA family protein